MPDDYAAQLNRCIHCGLCLQSCPTYRALGTEMDTPRGRIAILRAVNAGRLPISESLGRYIYHCLGCDACRVACPSGVATDAIMLGAKQRLGAKFLPAALAALEQRVRATHNIAGEPPEHRLLWAENLEGGLKDLVVGLSFDSAARPERSAAQSKDGAANARPERSTAQSKDGAANARPERSTAQSKDKSCAEVAFFTGCVAALYPMSYGIPTSLVRLFRAARVDFALLGPEEWCCGYPLLSAGRDATELIAHNLDRVTALGVETLVTGCPSCYCTWKTYYATSAFRVLHATDFLVELVDAGRLSLRALSLRVTYHDPCDLGRKSNLYDAPRRLLRAIPGIELVEMKANRENALCCGGGGNLESLDVGLSRAIAHERLEQAADTRAEVVVSACQQCERTLTMAARREAKRIKVMDISQLIDRAVLSGET
jgi:heterodisulfide reductase subunit D